MNDAGTSTPAVRTEDVWKVCPQEPTPVEAVRGLDLEVTPGDFVAMAGPSGSGKTTVLNLLGGVPPEERHRRVRALFAEMGLEGLEDRRPGKLSGGQQQRVAVARAVVGEPALVLADEPTANLDSATSAALLDIMEHLNLEHGVTFVFSTHDPRVMERARRLIRLVDGRIEDDQRKPGGNAHP